MRGTSLCEFEKLFCIEAQKLSARTEPEDTVEPLKSEDLIYCPYPHFKIAKDFGLLHCNDTHIA
jgi:hypothetical protein